jgi:GT2 family glycosyltransferase
MVRELFPEVRVVALTENVGFAAANNLALRRVTAPRVLLLNPDSELRPGVLDHMLDLVDSDPAIGVAGCRLVRRDGSFDHAAKRRFPTPAGALGHFLGLGRRIGATSAYTQYHAVDVGEHELGDVDSVNGAFMLVRREAMEEVGLLDAGYWMYGEDLDWCRRFKLAGWRVVYDGRVTAVHVKGASAGARRGPRQNIAFHLTMGRFYRRYDGGNRAAVDAAVYAGILVKLAVSLLVNWAHSRWRQRARLHDG